jgi:GntR family transcriptional regulator
MTPVGPSFESAGGFLVDPLSPVPIFRQIVDGLRAAIARGSIAAGELLPSVRALSERLGVNPNTVQKAFSELEREGLVAAERGRGMVVIGGTRESARAAGEHAVVERLADAVRHARAVGLSDERFELLLRKARRLAGERSKENGHGA